MDAPHNSSSENLVKPFPPWFENASREKMLAMSANHRTRVRLLSVVVLLVLLTLIMCPFLSWSFDQQTTFDHTKIPGITFKTAMAVSVVVSITLAILSFIISARSHAEHFANLGTHLTITMWEIWITVTKYPKLKRSNNEKKELCSAKENTKFDAETRDSDNSKSCNQQRLQRAAEALVRALPEAALSPEVLRNTPRRLADAMAYFTKGYGDSVKDAIGDAVFELASCQGLVAVRNLDVSSTCEHHLLPFYGQCHIVYLPGERILGLSKFSRIIEVFARRLQMQERLTAELAEGLDEALKPKGVFVKMECYHTCISSRSVGAKCTTTTTLVYRGAFERDEALRNEALALVG